MKTKEEIEQLAFLKYPRLINDPYNPMEDDNTYERQIWIDAYTQCQEDMNEVVSFFEEIWEQMNGKTDVRGDMVYIPWSLSQKIRNYKNKQ
jgi:hypothetical protein